MSLYEDQRDIYDIQDQKMGNNSISRDEADNRQTSRKTGETTGAISKASYRELWMTEFNRKHRKLRCFFDNLPNYEIFLGMPPTHKAEEILVY